MYRCEQITPKEAQRSLTTIKRNSFVNPDSQPNCFNKHYYLFTNLGFSVSLDQLQEHYCWRWDFPHSPGLFQQGPLWYNLQIWGTCSCSSGHHQGFSHLSGNKVSQVAFFFFFLLNPSLSLLMLKMLLVSGIFGADTTGGSLLWLLQFGEGPPGLACPALQHHHVLVGVVEILKFWSNSHVCLNTCFEIQGKQWSGVCVWVVFSHLIVRQKENLCYVGFPRSKPLQSPSAGYPSPGHCVDCLFLLLRFPPQSLFLPVKTHSNLWG